MPAVKEQIDRMTVREKYETMSYLWSSISCEPDVVPMWHADELRATEARVAAGQERPIPWRTAKDILARTAR